MRKNKIKAADFGVLPVFDGMNAPPKKIGPVAYGRNIVRLAKSMPSKSKARARHMKERLPVDKFFVY